MAAPGLARTLLYGLEPHDPATLALAGAVLVCAALAAAVRPALRAASIEPSRALHDN